MDKTILVSVAIIILIVALIAIGLYYKYSNKTNVPQSVTTSVHVTASNTAAGSATANSLSPSSGCPSAPASPSKQKVLYFVNASKSGGTFAACADSILETYKSEGILSKYNILYSPSGANATN